MRSDQPVGERRGGSRVALPALVTMALRRALPAADLDAVLGDLAESARAHPAGVRRGAWLTRQTVALVAWSLLDRLDRRAAPSIPSRKHRPMSNLLFEMRAAARGLRRSPGFAAAMVATIAIGVGGTTTVFALVHGILLAPLPYPQPDRLVSLWPTMWSTKALFRDIAERAELMQGVAGWTGGARVLSEDGDPELLLGPQVTPGFLSTLGYEPLHGRFLQPADSEPGAPPVVVLTHELFVERFAADPRLVGETIRLDSGSWTVVGVLPPGARVLQPDAQLVTPLTLDPSAHEYDSSYYLRLVARLAPGVTTGQASDEMGRLAESLRDEHELSEEQIRAARVVTLQEFLVGDRRPLLSLLMGAVALVLVVACVNAGNLTLARQLSRRGEVAVRSALGGSRARGLAFLGSESLLLAVTGGLVGTGLAAWALALVRAGRPLDLPRVAEVHLSPAVLAVTAAITAVAALAAGLLPALRTTRLDPATALRSGRGASMGRGTRLAREGLVVLEVALAVVLVAGAGLMARSLWDLARVDGGFEPEGRLILQLVPGTQGVGAELKVAEYYQRMVDAVERLPVTIRAASVNAAPVHGGGWRMATEIEGVEYPDPGELPISYWRVVSPDYFEALGARLERGRPIRATDVAGGEQVAVVNQAFARRHWPDQDPLGKRFRVPWESDAWIRVVGVVADIRHLGVRADAPETVYRPLDQAGPALQRVGVTSESLLIHARGAELDALRVIRDAIRDVDPTVPVVEPVSMRAAVRESLAEPRLLLQVLAAFGIAALVLSAVGIAGIVGELVRQRRREFGIRQALGARPAQIVGRSLRRGVLLGGLGLVAGAAATLALGPLMGSFLYRVRPRDPVTLAAVVCVLALCVAAASWIPSRRAARIDPAESLRVE